MELEFAVFCIENIARRLNRNGAEVYSLLAEKSDILTTYILANWEVLHTQDKDYIVDDILEVMRERGLVK